MWKACSKRRRGSVAVLVSLLLVALVGMAALTLDGGLMQDNKRRAQASADAAAMAAATTLFINYTSISQTTPDPSAAAVKAALASALQTSFANDGTNSTVTVNIPPKSGPFTGMLSYAQVIIIFNQPRYFSTVYGSQRLPLKARAGSRGYWRGTGDD